jgi:hypothetical protein
MTVVLQNAMDDKYLEIILNRILVCREYRPAFGQGQKVTLAEFQELYGSDPFYSWFGLNNALIYAAHRTAGGITSIYRQIGLGCEELIRQILQDHLRLNVEQVTWSYTTSIPGGRNRRLSLDGRIQLADVSSDKRRRVVGQWLNEAANKLEVAPEISKVLKGVVFEVRQGYKSKDSKRQNADIANAATAYSQGYLPVLLVLSTQIDNDIVERYEQAKWLILRGQLSNSLLNSTYAFTKEIIGYDLAGFFQRNSTTLHATIAEILQTLLREDAIDG